jgi:hypothetical protein
MLGLSGTKKFPEFFEIIGTSHLAGHPDNSNITLGVGVLISLKNSEIFHGHHFLAQPAEERWRNTPLRAEGDYNGPFVLCAGVTNCSEALEPLRGFDQDRSQGVLVQSTLADQLPSSIGSGRNNNLGCIRKLEVGMGVAKLDNRSQLILIAFRMKTSIQADLGCHDPGSSQTPM